MNQWNEILALGRKSYGIIIISVLALYMRTKLPEGYRLVINVSGFKCENVDKRILRCP